MARLHCIDLSETERGQLLSVARASILSGLDDGAKLQPDPSEFSAGLLIPSAVFITLTRNGELRGCIGSLEAKLPLLRAVADAAYNAAFRDRRFRPLEADEAAVVRIEISVLSEMQALDAADRQTLLDQLRPGVDGLMLEDRGCRATFLPKVWEKIGSSSDFVDQLLRKAGLAPDHWSSSIRCHRYQTLTFAES